MNALIIVAISIVVLGGGYLLYGRWLAKTWGIDPNAKTPAYEKEDGEDYIPTNSLVVFSHQFSSIAGAGPITGPIIACMFGWLPALLWILIGGVFFGAVQDFTSMYASVKTKGKTIGSIIENYIGKTGKTLFLIFEWLFSLLVIAAFADMVAGTFSGFAPDTGAKIYANGGTASMTMLFIFGAVIFGFFMKYAKPKGGVMAACGIVFTAVLMLIGLNFPLYADKGTWLAVIFAYLFIAAALPMWVMIQPRDYLSTFLLLTMIAGAVIGLLVMHPSINLPVVTSFNVNGKMLFPMLFVTIACGAVSGFHSLVSSSTSSRQIKNEKDMLPIGYGAMLLESLLAVVALCVAGAAADPITHAAAQGTPFAIFSKGVASFLVQIGMPQDAAMCVMNMAVSTLALTSLDAVARIGRIAFQELFGQGSSSVAKFLSNKYISTIITLACGCVLSLGGYNNIWPLFGSANQLLAALVLISLAVFLKCTGRQGWMLYVPMFVMLAVTFTALVQSIISIVVKLGSNNFVFMTDGLQLIVAVLLVALGVMVAASCLKTLFGKKGDSKKATSDTAV
ncbi:carbon starvation CstA family protein [Caproicibacterium sp. NSD3]